MSDALEVTSVTKRYGSVTALAQVSLDVEAGEHVAIIGASGSGKSTLLRVIAGLERPDSGTVAVAGNVVASDKTWLPAYRRNIGMVFQDHALFPHLNVARNVGFGLNKLRRRERDRRVAEALEMVGLGGYGKRRPHELSGGEQQRVALARALAPKPDVILLDEPFSNLDENLRAQVRNDTAAVLEATSSAVVLVTHDQAEALAFGRRVAVMSAGSIEQYDLAHTVYTHPVSRYVASFMGDTVYLPVNPDGLTALGRLPGVDHGDEVMLRPHDLRLTPEAPGNGVVLRVEYAGAVTRYQVMLDVGQIVNATVRDSNLRPADRVTVSIAPDAQPVPVSAG